MPRLQRLLLAEATDSWEVCPHYRCYPGVCTVGRFSTKGLANRGRDSHTKNRKNTPHKALLTVIDPAKRVRAAMASTAGEAFVGCETFATRSQDLPAA